MSSLAGRVRLPRVTVLSVVVGLVCGGRRWAPRRAPWRLVAGCLGRLPGLSERRRGAPGNGQLLDGQRSSGQFAPPFPLGGYGQLTIGGLKVLRPAPGRRRARRCVCARHAVGARGAVVGGSSWSAPGRAALLEPPAVASVAAAARCAGPLPSVGREAIHRRLAIEYLSLGAPVGREPGRPLWSSAARTRAEPRRAPPPSLVTVP